MINAIPKDIVDLIYSVLHRSYYNKVTIQYCVLYSELAKLDGNMTRSACYTSRRVMWRDLTAQHNYLGVYAIADVFKYCLTPKLPRRYKYSYSK